MYFVRAYAALPVCFLFATPLLAQQPSTTAPPPLQRDAQAIALATQSLTNMRGNQAASAVQDSVANGTLQLSTSKGAVTLPITIKTKGTTLIRSEIQWPQGTRVRILNSGRAALTKPDGGVQWLVANNTVAERAGHIPFLSLLSEVQAATTEVASAGTGSVNSVPTSVVALSYIPSSDAPSVSFYRGITQAFFHIDPNSNLVLKMQYQAFAENDTNYSQKVEVIYSNYKQVAGLWVPFTQTTYVDGKLESTLNLTSVAFNVGLLDSEFALPAVN